MDYFQGTVENYLRADRKLFLNSEYLLQLDPDKNLPLKDRHWYVDVLAIDFRDEKIWLCEITYSKTLSALLKRLRAWQENWDELKYALQRDTLHPEGFTAQPWIFVPTEMRERFIEKFVPSNSAKGMPNPRITNLDRVLPWNYKTWNRPGYVDEA